MGSTRERNQVEPFRVPPPTPSRPCAPGHRQPPLGPEEFVPQMRCYHQPPSCLRKALGKGIKRGLKRRAPQHTHTRSVLASGQLGCQSGARPSPRCLVSQSQPLSSWPRTGCLCTGPMGPGDQSSWSPTKDFSRPGQGPSGDREGCKGRGVRSPIGSFMSSLDK